MERARAARLILWFGLAMAVVATYLYRTYWTSTPIDEVLFALLVWALFALAGFAAAIALVVGRNRLDALHVAVATTGCLATVGWVAWAWIMLPLQIAAIPLYVGLALLLLPASIGLSKVPAHWKRLVRRGGPSPPAG